MAHLLKTIRKRSTFVMIRKKGKFSKGTSFNIQFLEDPMLNNSIHIGFTATKN